MEFIGKHSTLKTVTKYGFDRAEFDAYVKDFGYTTKNHKDGYIVILGESEDGTIEEMDYAHPILVNHNGEKYGLVIFSEMNTIFTIDNEWYSTEDTEIICDMPLHAQRAIRQAKKENHNRLWANQPEQPTTENQPEKEENLTMTMPSNYHTVIVKIVNDKANRGQVIQSSSDQIAVDTEFNSTEFNGKPLGSTWLCEIRLTGKGSRKVESITRFDKSTSALGIESSSAPVATTEVTTEDSTESIVEPFATIAANTPEPTTIEQPEPTIARELTANVREWECADYYISPDARLVFATGYKMLQSKPSQSIKILMTGESGYGKTTIAERFADFVGFDCLRVNCATMRDTTEWFFDTEIKTNPKFGTPEMIYTKSDFALAMARGNCVVILDEFNRLEPNMHNSLFPIFDSSGATRIKGMDFTVGPNVIFVATINLGYKYTGVFPLDEAVTNRFEFILEVGPMPYDSEIAVLESAYNLGSATAEEIVKLATKLRDNDLVCSTRTTLAISKMVANGMTIRDAFEFACVRRIPNDDSGAPVRKAIVDLINTEIGARAIEYASFR